MGDIILLPMHTHVIVTKQKLSSSTISSMENFTFCNARVINGNIFKTKLCSVIKLQYGAGLYLLTTLVYRE